MSYENFLKLSGGKPPSWDVDQIAHVCDLCGAPNSQDGCPYLRRGDIDPPNGCLLWIKINLRIEAMAVMIAKIQGLSDGECHET